jgi:hypothetical protein
VDYWLRIRWKVSKAMLDAWTDSLHELVMDLETMRERVTAQYVLAGEYLR